MSAALQLLRARPGFRRLWLGSIVSQLGDWVGWVAVAMVALHEGGGPLDVALVFAAHHLPAAALGPVAGALADRVDRRRLLWGTSVLLGLATVGMVIAAAAGALGALQLLLVVRSGGTALFTPAERAALPRVVEPGELLLAGAIDSASWSVMFAVGMAAGGVLTLLGPTVALAIDAATFGLAALLFSGLPAIEPSGAASRPKLLRGAVDALAYVWPRPALRRAVFAKTPFALAGGAAWIALALQADALAGASVGLGFGLLHAVRGVGTGAGPVLTARWVGRGVARPKIWRSAYWTGLAGVGVLGVAGSGGLLALGALAWGLGGGTNWVVSTEQIQRHTHDSIMARTHAVDLIGMTLAMTLGVAGVALAVEAGATLGAAVAGVVAVSSLGWWALDRCCLDL